VNRRNVAVLAALMAAASGGLAHALDRPIDGAKLILEKAAGRETLIFVSRDPRVPFPAVGGSDDPATGEPGGARIELFSLTEGIASLAVPRGTGTPGWRTKRQGGERRRFVNPAAPAGTSVVRAAVLKKGRGLRLVAKATGLPLAGPQGAVGIRVTMGTMRSCALFGRETIRKDEAGKFIARGARASSLADCSGASLGAAVVTTTTAAATSTTGAHGTTTTLQPAEGCHLADETVEPACEGVCPAGETCAAELDERIAPVCVCRPDGVDPCLGSSYPECGGYCAAGKRCQAFHLLPGQDNPEIRACACVDPRVQCSGAPGACRGLGVCPPGQVCAGVGPPTLACECAAP
jgi:hypothetical protein